MNSLFKSNYISRINFIDNNLILSILMPYFGVFTTNFPNYIKRCE